jgi:hypothetical protein
MNIADMKKPHFVYLMQGEGTDYFKIGMSIDATRRKRGYSVPFRMIIVKVFQARDYWDALDLEKRVQRLYRNRRCHGEWFRGLNPTHFIDDLEWFAMKDYDRAEKEYLSRGESYKDKPREIPEVVPKKDTPYQDRLILETLREEGLDAALALRKEFADA